MSVDELITDQLELWTGATTQAANGRGKNGNVELTGIQKLRELILELAIRGKLDQSDPNDHPAEQQYEEITTAKNRLIQKGHINKPRELPPITEKECSFTVPQGWTWVRLGNLLRVINGRAYKKHEMLDHGTPLLRVGNLFTSNTWYYSDLHLEDDKYIESRDLIYAWSASFGPFIWKGQRAIYHYHIWKLDLFDGTAVDKLFIYYYLNAITEKIKSSGNGIAMIHMTKSKMEELPLPLPPTAEQHRIVHKVDELMALCDRLEQQTSDQLEAHETLVDTLLNTLTQSENATELTDNWARVAAYFDTLFTTEQSIDKLKQTVLQLAVMGRLVEQYEGDEQVADFLERIEDEKSRLIANGSLRKRKAPAQIETDEVPFPTPKSWKWVRLETIAETHTGYAFKSQEYTTHGTFVLRVININKDGKINTKDAKYITSDAARTEYYKFKLSEGDVLLVMVGGSLGKIGLVDSSILPAVLNQNMWKFQIFGDISTDYFIYGLKQINAYQLAITNSTHGHLSQGDYLSKLFPLPPLEEQYRIAEKVNELIELCNRLKERLNRATETRCQLAETVVDTALQ